MTAYPGSELAWRSAGTNHVCLLAEDVNEATVCDALLKGGGSWQVQKLVRALAFRSLIAPPLADAAAVSASPPAR